MAAGVPGKSRTCSSSSRQTASVGLGTLKDASKALANWSRRAPSAAKLRVRASFLRHREPLARPLLPNQLSTALWLAGYLIIIWGDVCLFL
jgi:hypothetical protein